MKAVFTDLNNLTVSYDQLLEEVARMGSDFNPEDPRLCDVVDNLRSLRSTSADDDDDDDVGDGGIRLFVTPTGGQK